MPPRIKSSQAITAFWEQPQKMQTEKEDEESIPYFEKIASATLWEQAESEYKSKNAAGS